MQFVYPAFLFALGSIIIPVIIHLFNFRRYKKIVFSDIRFLKQVQQESKAKRKLKEWLVLACRILAISFLVLAFAQPFIPAQQQSGVAGQRSVSLFIDNSFSMNNEGKEGQLLETAKTKARDILGVYGNTDLFQVITNDAEGRHQRLVNRNEALQWIDEIRLSPASRNLEEIYARQKQAFETAPSSGQVIYYISDFQKSQFADLDEFKPDSAIQINMVPVSVQDHANISIDSVWLNSPVVRVNEPLKLRVRISNHANDDADNITLNLKLNGVQKGLQNLDCEAGSSAEAEFVFTINDNSWQKGEISINDHPITFDDHLYFAFKASSTSNVLCINGYEQNPFIVQLLATDKSIHVNNVSQNQVDYTAFNRYQLIILNECAGLSSGLIAELKKYLSKNGQILLIPSSKPADVLGYSTFLGEAALPLFGNFNKQRVQVTKLDLKDELFRNVFIKVPKNIDLPEVLQYYTLSASQQSRGKALMSLANDAPFLWKATVAKGNVFLLAAPLNNEWSNLQRHSLFIPLMLKLSLGKSVQSTLYYTTGRDKWITLPDAETSGEKVVHIGKKNVEIVSDLVQHDNKTEAYIDDQLKEAGLYDVAFRANNQPLAVIAMNYPRTESEMKYRDEAEISSWAGKQHHALLRNEETGVLKNQIALELNGTALWRWCVLLALVFLLVEILLLRLIR